MQNTLKDAKTSKTYLLSVEEKSDGYLGLTKKKKTEGGRKPRILILCLVIIIFNLHKR